VQSHTKSHARASFAGCRKIARMSSYWGRSPQRQKRMKLRSRLAGTLKGCNRSHNLHGTVTPTGSLIQKRSRHKGQAPPPRGVVRCSLALQRVYCSSNESSLPWKLIPS